MVWAKTATRMATPRKAELAGRVEHARADAAEDGRKRGHTGGSERRQGDPQAGARKSSAPGHVGERIVTREMSQERESDRGEQRPAERRPAGSDAVDEASGERSEDQSGRRHEGHRGGRLELTVVHESDEVDDEHERRPHHRHIDGRDGNVGGGERTAAKEMQVEQRL